MAKKLFICFSTGTVYVLRVQFLKQEIRGPISLILETWPVPAGADRRGLRESAALPG